MDQTQIVLHPGLAWESLPAPRVSVMISQDHLESRLNLLRAEWIEATAGNMTAVTVNLNTIFDDIYTIIQGA